MKKLVQSITGESKTTSWVLESDHKAMVIAIGLEKEALVLDNDKLTKSLKRMTCERVNAEGKGFFFGLVVGFVIWGAFEALNWT